MARARIVPNRRAIGALLKSSGTRDLITRKTREVADAAQAAAEPDHGQFRTDISVGGKRVRGAVIGDYATSDPEDSRRALLRGLNGGTS